MENRLESIEVTLAQLIKMVSSVIEVQKKMWHDLQALQKDICTLKDNQAKMQKDIHTLKEKQEAMRKVNHKEHRKIMEQLQFIRADHNHTWSKVVQNERKIAIIEETVGIDY